MVAEASFFIPGNIFQLISMLTHCFQVGWGFFGFVSFQSFRLFV